MSETKLDFSLSGDQILQELREIKDSVADLQRDLRYRGNQWDEAKERFDKRLTSVETHLASLDKRVTTIEATQQEPPKLRHIIAPITSVVGAMVSVITLSILLKM